MSMNANKDGISMYMYVSSCTKYDLKNVTGETDF